MSADPLPDRHLATIVVYGRHSCIFCRRTVQWLDQQGLDHRFVVTEGAPAVRSALASVTGLTTVPQIFVHGRSVGGYQDLMETARQGRLEALLQEPPPDDAPVR